MATAEYNAFFRGPEGIKQHIKVLVSDDVDPETNDAILASDVVQRLASTIPAALIAAGATREESAAGLPQPAQQPRPAPAPAAPPTQFQPGPQGAGVSRIHQACGNPMQFIPAGVSRANNRAYPAFFKCGAGCLGQNGRAYTENA